MKAELRLRPHTLLPGAQVIEVWYAGEFLATVIGADGPGVRIISKHTLDVIRGGEAAPAAPFVLEVQVTR